VDSPTEFVRVGGASIGSATVSGLAKGLLSNSPTVSAVLAESLNMESSHSSTDLLVEDIYGGDCDSIGLPGSIIASSFGKAGLNSAKDLPAETAKSLIDIVTINTAQLTSLHAQLNGCTSAIIVGSISGSDEFLPISECIQRVLNILNRSGQGIDAIYLKQSKFLGCLGALLQRPDKGDGTTPRDTATIQDFVDDETYTKLRIGSGSISPTPVVPIQSVSGVDSAPH
jgi:type II pantothenate kinase